MLLKHASRSRFFRGKIKQTGYITVSAELKIKLLDHFFIQNNNCKGIKNKGQKYQENLASSSLRIKLSYK